MLPMQLFELVMAMLLAIILLYVAHKMGLPADLPPPSGPSAARFDGRRSYSAT